MFASSDCRSPCGSSCRTTPGGGGEEPRSGGARGRYVLFLDDDVVAECQLVSAHLDVLRPDDHIVGIGRIDKVPVSSAHPAGLGPPDGLADHYDRLAAGREPRFNDAYGGNLSLPRRDFLAAGGFALTLRRSRTSSSATAFGMRHDIRLRRRCRCREEDRIRSSTSSPTPTSRRRRRHALPATPWASAASWLGGAGELRRQLDRLPAALARLSVPSTLPRAWRQACADRDVAGSWLSSCTATATAAAFADTVDRTPGVDYNGGHDPDVPRDRAGSASRGRSVCRSPDSSANCAWLKRRRYNVISLDEFVDARRTSSAAGRNRRGHVR